MCSQTPPRQIQDSRPNFWEPPNQWLSGRKQRKPARESTKAPRLRSDPVLSHPAAWEEEWPAVVTELVLLTVPHLTGPEETSLPLLSGRAPHVPSFCSVGFGTKGTWGPATEDLPLQPGHGCPSICSAVTCCLGGLFWALCTHPIHRFRHSPFLLFILGE